MNNNWKLLSELKHKQVWDFVYDKLLFRPTNDDEKELIILPHPNKCFDISNFYNKGFIEELYDDLHISILLWFDRISNHKRMYALNWQHECYSFDVDLPFEKNEFDEWLVPVFPNGDYIFFLTGDFQNGIFADGINLTLSLWGGEVIKALEYKTPKILTQSPGCR